MATNDELLKAWAAQNGADYNLLAGAAGGSTGSTGSYDYTAPSYPASTTPTGATGAAATAGATGTSPGTGGNGYTSTGNVNGTSLNVSGVGTGNAKAQAIVDNSYNEFMRKLQEISAGTGVPVSELVNMAQNTPGYGTWTNGGQLVVNDQNTGQTIVSGGGAGAGSITPVIPSGGTGAGAGTGGTGTGGEGIVGGNGPGALALDRTQAIRDMYDAQLAAQRAALQESGDQALSDAQANRDNIAALYNKQRNAASVDWERQRRNFLEGAATSGLNTGATGQAELSMNSMFQQRQNTLGAAQAQAEAEADRNIADIKRSTQASINEAIAKNDYQRAAALLDEYNDLYNRYMDRAEALAAYGDFSGYASLYGDAAAANMRQIWVMSNPEIALATGQITQQQYAALTLYKQYPTLALTGGSGFSSGGGGNGNTGNSDSAAIAAAAQAMAEEMNQPGFFDEWAQNLANSVNNGG